MDIKIAGIDEEVLRRALAQAKEGRIHILNEMRKTISAPKSELSPKVIVYYRLSYFFFYYAL